MMDYLGLMAGIVTTFFLVAFSLTSIVGFFDWRDCVARGNIQYETKYEGFTCFIKAENEWYTRDEYINRRNIFRMNLNENGELSK